MHELLTAPKQLARLAVFHKNLDYFAGFLKVCKDLAIGKWPEKPYFLQSLSDDGRDEGLTCSR
eukprot:gene11511-11654_t